MSRKKNKLVYGWGVNDVDYDVRKYEELPKVNDKRKRKQIWTCPYYKKWKSMLERCFCPKYQEKYPTYKGCTICEEWKYLSNFIKWADSQPNRDWQNCEPDKDFLSFGNKHYSPETVVFIPKNVNLFIGNSGKARGDYMIGVCYLPELKKNLYRARCSDPFGGSEHTGYYRTELEAHKAWQAKKHEYALQLSDLQQDERIASRLREMYAPDKDWTDK